MTDNQATEFAHDVLEEMHYSQIVIGPGEVPVLVKIIKEMLINYGFHE